MRFSPSSALQSDNFAQVLYILGPLGLFHNPSRWNNLWLWLSRNSQNSFDRIMKPAPHGARTEERARENKFSLLDGFGWRLNLKINWWCKECRLMMVMIVMCDALDVCHAIIYITQFEFGASARLYRPFPNAIACHTIYVNLTNDSIKSHTTILEPILRHQRDALYSYDLK